MIRTLVFDFGNVIGFFDHQRAIRRLAEHTHLPPQEFASLIYLNNLDVRYESGQVTTEEVYAVACQLGGLRCSQAEFVDAFADIFWPNPPVADLVRDLKRSGYRLVLASNTNLAHYERFREQFRDVLTHFDAISVSHEAGARKPDRAFFEYTHRMANCEKREAVFIDDLAENVEGAKRFGWHGLTFVGVEPLADELRRLGIPVA